MRNLAFFMALTSSLLIGCAAGDEGLTAIHADIVADYETVAHLSAKDLLKLKPDTVVLLDIREADEYEVSRIPNAVRISPSLDTGSALDLIGDVRGKHVIVYCSVGRRSSAFATRAQSGLRGKGAARVSNLENGIFGWHNQTRALVDAKGATDFVHPYNSVWKRYVTRKDKARYTRID